MSKPNLKFVLLVLVNISFIYSIDNGLGITPPMGWNGWNQFRCQVNETVIKQTVDRIIQLGLDKKGYTYINLDDCWHVGRQFWSRKITIDNCKFPSGMNGLADYLHSKNLKFGLYSDAGTNTCEGRPGSYGFEEIDAKTFAEWGYFFFYCRVDYLKYDNCYNLNISSLPRYQAMSQALNKTGRPIFFSMCNWGQENVWEWGNATANSWRTTGDIGPRWDSVMQILDKQVGLQKYAGKGGWNDPDMLEFGNGNLTYHESLSHFTLWCLLKAPLILGCDLTSITQELLSVISNEELIAINQDELGIQGTRIKLEKDQNIHRQVWGGPLSGDRYAVVFLNRQDQLTSINVSLKDDLKLEFSDYKQRDPIRHHDVEPSKEEVITVQVEPHGVQVRILILNKGQAKDNLVS